MDELKKFGLLLIFSLILFYGLVSPRLFPNIVLDVKDAFLIVVLFLLISAMLKVLNLYDYRKLEKKLSAQYFQMNAIINNSPFIIFLKSLDGKILMANDQLANLIGEKKEKLIGTNAYNFLKNQQFSKDEDSIVLKEKRIISEERIVELANGQSHWFRIVKAPVFDEKGDILSLVIIFRNIDDVKDLEERKSNFIATLTHDLKTPTIAQIHALDLLLGGTFGKLNSEQEEMINQIKSSCNYMYDLIFTILDTYLYDNGLIKINPEKFDIISLIKETAKGLSNLLNERGQSLVINSDLETNTVVADKVQIKRVLINLIGNAISHGFKNSQIEIFISDKSDSIKFEIKNKSEYINKEQMKDIFAKYKQVKHSKSIKTSTGLGLYLSKQIIDAHNGQVYASSDEQKNCSFGFTIPRTVKNLVNV